MDGVGLKGKSHRPYRPSPKNQPYEASCCQVSNALSRNARQMRVFCPATGLPTNIVIFFILPFDSSKEPPYIPAPRRRAADAAPAKRLRRNGFFVLVSGLFDIVIEGRGTWAAVCLPRGSDESLNCKQIKQNAMIAYVPFCITLRCSIVVKL